MLSVSWFLFPLILTSLNLAIKRKTSARYQNYIPSLCQYCYYKEDISSIYMQILHPSVVHTCNITYLDQRPQKQNKTKAQIELVLPLPMLRFAFFAQVHYV